MFCLFRVSTKPEDASGSYTALPFPKSDTPEQSTPPHSVGSGPPQLKPGRNPLRHRQWSAQIAANPGSGPNPPRAREKLHFGAGSARKGRRGSPLPCPGGLALSGFAIHPANPPHERSCSVFLPPTRACCGIGSHRRQALLSLRSRSPRSKWYVFSYT